MKRNLAAWGCVDEKNIFCSAVVGKDGFRKEKT